jgi:3',5'-cyclic AMP phosphodiesterase CpdA
MKKYISFLLLLFVLAANAQKIPAVFGNLSKDSTGALIARTTAGQVIPLQRTTNNFNLEGVTPIVNGAKDGLHLRFPSFKLIRSRITYGLIPYGHHTFPSAVLRFSASIDTAGRAFLNLRRDIGEGYDFTGWRKSGKGNIGYRITDMSGLIVYEGKLSFSMVADSIVPRTTLLRGPFVSNLAADSVVIWYQTSEPVQPCLLIQDASIKIKSFRPAKYHEITVRNLRPDALYAYQICVAGDTFQYSFRTAPSPGSETPFSFAYASDSRSGYGGGERNIYGANAQIMTRIAAIAKAENARFVQFTGDLANGYLSDPNEMDLQLTNWIHSVEPWWHYIPFNVGMGNHESVGWANQDGRVLINGFPYETHSGESVFARNFVNPTNGPVSEDGADYDPNPSGPGDFPSYKENVYFYTYGNAAMIVLNSNYWFSPSLRSYQEVGGNLHGYVMDKQLEWLENTLSKMEKDRNIDHIFITIHTPPFPNGGHRGDCMWYNGNNDPRPYIAGKGVEKGIIERRDQILDLCANRSSKVVGFLSGDEHNYNHMVIDNATPRYPANWDKPRVSLSRPLWQFINGAAGAPFYAQQEAPWSALVKSFTVQNALCFFDIDGKKIRLRVFNPDTLELIDEAQIR